VFNDNPVLLICQEKIIFLRGVILISMFLKSIIYILNNIPHKETWQIYMNLLKPLPFTQKMAFFFAHKKPPVAYIHAFIKRGL